ncbi:MAG: type IV secretion protein Rhs, partial [Hymenobacter sp.]
DVILHEWSELEVGPGVGSIEHLATWLFEEDSFAPAAKLTAQGSYSVVADHLGTPLAMYDGQGKECWQMQLDSYGAVRQGQGRAQDCPFRYQGQYEDVETGLYYNRFRYYDPEIGQYISQDPILLRGGMSLYSYVANTCSWVDVLGLNRFKPITWTAPSKGTGNTYKVYQQPINWDLSSNGLGGVKETNLERATRGDTPFVKKGGKYSLINLHHSQQNAQGPLYELSAETHVKYGQKKALHPYKPKAHPDYPVDRPAFNIDKVAYWIERAAAENESRNASTGCS